MLRMYWTGCFSISVMARGKKHLPVIPSLLFLIWGPAWKFELACAIRPPWVLTASAALGAFWTTLGGHAPNAHHGTGSIPLIQGRSVMLPQSWHYRGQCGNITEAVLTLRHARLIRQQWVNVQLKHFMWTLFAYALATCSLQKDRINNLSGH